MSEYLTYKLWQQREERMPRELEQQRVVQERLNEQKAQLAQELVVSTEVETSEPVNASPRDEYVLVNE